MSMRTREEVHAVENDSNQETKYFQPATDDGNEGEIKRMLK